MKQKPLHSFSSWPDDYRVKVVTIAVDSSVIPSPQEPSLEQVGPPSAIKYLPIGSACVSLTSGLPLHLGCIWQSSHPLPAANLLKSAVGTPTSTACLGSCHQS